MVRKRPGAWLAEPPVSGAALGFLLLVTGAIAIGLEVLWTRALDQVLSGTVYSFATVLSVYLAGIALGGWAYRRPRRLGATWPQRATSRCRSPPT